MLKFDVTKKCLVGEGWCPIFAKAQIQEALQHATFDSNSQVGIIYHVMDAVEPPPTYFRTNRFTNAFQEIVDAYGISLLLEANPAVYTVITFPFLFAVMFGDWGHGIAFFHYNWNAFALVVHLLFFLLQNWEIFLFCYYFCFISKQKRYIDSTYKKMHRHIWLCDISKSNFVAFFELSQNEDVYFVWGDPDEHRNCIYLNAHFFGSSLDIRFQFVLQMIFLNRLFGYLLLLIIIKWCTGSQSDLYHRPLQLIQLLVSYCSSMDALSKTFYFEAASFGGVSRSYLWDT
ncbi:unnamed protein product, partial [Vitis vinifera]